METPQRPNKNMFKPEPKSAPELGIDLADQDTVKEVEPTEVAASEDPKTEAAVEDIMKHDGDEALEAQDDRAKTGMPSNRNWWGRVKDCVADWWSSPRARWITIGAIVVVLGALAAVPYTRYAIGGLVIKSTATVTVVDSKSGAPISGAKVQLGDQITETNAKGVATLQVRAGNKKLVVSKDYYQGATATQLVTFSGNKFKTSIVALGRQVKVKVVNTLTDKPLAGAVIAIKTAKTTTNADGLATVVIPSSTTTQEAQVSLSGYITATVKVDAEGNLAKNTFKIAPAGKLYFLSNLSGRLDVVKTNLDGSDRQVVLEGTGSEDKYSTSLLASRDWKYLALLSKRSNSSNASLYLIDTGNGDKLTTIDEGDANFSLIGWSGSNFVYQVNRNGYNDWQPRAQALKSFDATTGRTLLLDQTDAIGSNGDDYFKQYFSSPYLIGNQVVYTKNWTKYYYNLSAYENKAAQLDTIGVDGSGHKTVKSFTIDGPTNNPLAIGARLYAPNEIFIKFGNDVYEYKDGKVASTTEVTGDTFYNDAYPTYLLSPSGNSTFWSDPRDGKNVLFVGNAEAKSAKQVGSLTDYKTYGWYTENYLLVSKNSSELYILPTAGGTPYKITDYYKPGISYEGYGGGYGGL